MKADEILKNRDQVLHYAYESAIASAETIINERFNAGFQHAHLQVIKSVADKVLEAINKMGFDARVTPGTPSLDYTFIRVYLPEKTAKSKVEESSPPAVRWEYRYETMKVDDVHHRLSSLADGENTPLTRLMRELADQLLDARKKIETSAPAFVKAASDMSAAALESGATMEELPAAPAPVPEGFDGISFKMNNANKNYPDITIGGKNHLPLTRFEMVCTHDNPMKVTMYADFGSTEVELDGYFVSDHATMQKVKAMVEIAGYVPPPNKKAIGIYKKYHVFRADGTDRVGGKHCDCSYFVLDLSHDKFAEPALRAYADACKAEYPVLASDLYMQADKLGNL